MEKVCEFLQKAKIFYVATVKGDQPRVRPFGVAHIIAGKLREDEKETFPTELAKSIAKKGIVVAPTLVMMETFSKSGQSGYQKSDYSNAEAAVKLLHDCGVPILAATDANPGSFAPGVGYGDTLHHEMGLLTKAGLTPIEVLTAASSQNADAFGLKAGRITVGQSATMVLVEGRPDREITDSLKIRKVWVKGEQII